MKTAARPSSNMNASRTPAVRDLEIGHVPPNERASMTRSRRITLIPGLAVVAVFALALAGCSSASQANGSTPRSNSGEQGTVDVATSGLGQILVDSQGRTLYLFAKDTGTQSECTGACASAWPPLRATGNPTVGGGADASLVASSMRSDGSPQVTYAGHPLYLFSGDQNPGDTNGEGLVAYGASWYAVSPAGDQITGQASSSGVRY
jgi:predicted lipoprotein with Yx(FWY)xxD motif